MHTPGVLVPHIEDISSMGFMWVSKNLWKENMYYKMKCFLLLKPGSYEIMGNFYSAKPNKTSLEVKKMQQKFPKGMQHIFLRGIVFN